MFSKLKTTILTVGIAAATLLGSGQTWALDINYDTSGTGEVPIPGCDSDPSGPGGIWYVQRNEYDGDTQRSFNLRAGSGSSGSPGGATIIINAPNDNQQWVGERFGFDIGGGFIIGEISDYCTNLTQLTTEYETGYSDGSVGYADVAFIGTVFTALDSNDGQTWWYTFGFEGVTGTIPVFRRCQYMEWGDDELLHCVDPLVAAPSAVPTLPMWGLLLMGLLLAGLANQSKAFFVGK